MSAGTDRSLSPVLRVLLGAIGTSAVVAGGMVMVGGVRGIGVAAGGSALARGLAIVVAAVVTLGGVALLRGAWRGRIVHRRNAPPRGVR
jgi:hypothetical protein